MNKEIIRKLSETFNKTEQEVEGVMVAAWQLKKEEKTSGTCRECANYQGFWDGSKRSAKCEGCMAVRKPVNWTDKNIDKLLNDVRRKARTIKCPEYLTKRIFDIIDRMAAKKQKVKQVDAK